MSLWLDPTQLVKNLCFLFFNTVIFVHSKPTRDQRRAAGTHHDLASSRPPHCQQGCISGRPPRASLSNRSGCKGPTVASSVALCLQKSPRTPQWLLGRRRWRWSRVRISSYRTSHGICSASLCPGCLFHWTPEREKANEWDSSIQRYKLSVEYRVTFLLPQAFDRRAGLSKMSRSLNV